MLCTLGIKPTFPNTGFGYVEFEQEGTSPLKKVHQFREKPDYETAKGFLAQGNFLWNAGIFMWSVSTILNAFKRYQPSQYALFEKGVGSYNTAKEAAFILENYPKAENVSIDYAILEHSESTFVLPATFDWNDLGTWGSLYDKLDKDENRNAIVNSKMIGLEASGNMVRSKKGKLVVIDGLNDYIIVDKNEVLLIYPKAKEQDIKQVLAKVRAKYGETYT